MKTFKTIHKDCGGDVSIDQFEDEDCVSVCSKCNDMAPEHLDLLDTLFYFGVYENKKEKAK